MPTPLSACSVRPPSRCSRHCERPGCRARAGCAVAYGASARAGRGVVAVGQCVLPLGASQRAAGHGAGLARPGGWAHVPAVGAPGVAVDDEQVVAVGGELRRGSWLGSAGSGAPSGCWVRRSQRRIVPSGPPVASVRPSGLRTGTRPVRRARRTCGWPASTSWWTTAGPALPAAAHDEAPVGGEARDVHTVSVPGSVVRRRSVATSTISTPPSRRARDGQRPAVGAERHVADRAGSERTADRAAGGQRPQARRRSNVAPRGHEPPVGAEAGREDLLAVGAQALMILPRRGSTRRRSRGRRRRRAAGRPARIPCLSPARRGPRGNRESGLNVRASISVTCRRRCPTARTPPSELSA